MTFAEMPYHRPDLAAMKAEYDAITARLRAAADEAEELCDEDYWPLPCYSRLLFYTE